MSDNIRDLSLPAGAAGSAGFFRYLTKPIRVTEFLEALGLLDEQVKAELRRGQMSARR